MLRNGLEPWHIVVLALVIALLFGWKKMPDMARSFGRSARILRSEVDEMKSDKKTEAPAGSVNNQQRPADAAQNTTPASPVPSAAGVQDDAPAKDPAGVRVQDDVLAKDPAGHNTTT